MQFTAGTEVKRCLVGGGSLQAQGEFRLLPPGDAVPAGDLSSVGIVDIQGVVDQPEPAPGVLSIPEHSIMTLSLRTFQRNAHSCLCDPVPWGLGHTRIHGACSQDTKGHTAEEHRAHGRERQGAGIRLWALVETKRESRKLEGPGQRWGCPSQLRRCAATPLSRGPHVLSEDRTVPPPPLFLALLESNVPPGCLVLPAE